MIRPALSLAILLLAGTAMAATDSGKEFKLGLTAMSQRNWDIAIRHFSYVEKAHPKYSRAQDLIREAQDHKINDPKRAKAEAEAAAKQAKKAAANRPRPQSVDQFWEKLQKSASQFAALGLRKYGIEGSILFFQADQTWRTVPYDQKERFLEMMMGSWKEVNSVGRVEIRDFYNGRVIGKAGVWGITVKE